MKDKNKVDSEKKLNISDEMRQRVREILGELLNDEEVLDRLVDKMVKTISSKKESNTQ